MKGATVACSYGKKADWAINRGRRFWGRGSGSELGGYQGTGWGGQSLPRSDSSKSRGITKQEKGLRSPPKKQKLKPGARNEKKEEYPPNSGDVANNSRADT